MKPAPIHCEAIDLRYGKCHALRSLSWSAEEGEFHVLLGESGCGKTSLLRAIAGFERIGAGRLSLAGEVVDDGGGWWVPPERRRVGMVFQDYALFPHLRVEENIRFGASSLELVASLQRSTGLGALGDRRPDTLSGGQQQRVALARALASEPRLLLLDEPFSHLDPALRASLRELSREMVKEQGLTALLVTHDAVDAFSLADRISVMHEGTILQTGRPEVLYRTPNAARVARSLGIAQYLPGELRGEKATTPLGPLEVVAAEGLALPPEGAEGGLLIRPEQILLDPEGALVRCIDATFMGRTIRTRIGLPNGSRLLADLDPAARVEVGSELRISVRGPVCWVPDAPSGQVHLTNGA